VRWYRLAAYQGQANAQNALGVMYQNGEGVPQDYVEAVRWYRLAANGCVPLEAFDVWLSFAWL
jgi:TPR repeat protein